MAAIIVYPVLAIVLPIVFYMVKRKYIWFSILVAVVSELVIYRLDFAYYEARPFFILFTLIQIVVMSIIILILTKVIDKR